MIIHIKFTILTVFKCKVQWLATAFLCTWLWPRLHKIDSKLLFYLFLVIGQILSVLPYIVFSLGCYQTQALGLADSYLPSLYSFSHLTLVCPKPQNLSSHFSVKSFWMVSSSPQKKYKHLAFKASWSHCSLPCGWSPLAFHTLCFISCQTLRQVGWVRNGDTWDQLEK